MYKVCSDCKIEKDLSNFNKRSSKCKDCQKEYDRLYFEKNKLKRQQQKKEHYAANKKVINEKHKKYYQENKDKINKQWKERIKTDTNFRIRKSLSKRLKAAVKKQQTTKRNSILSYIGCSLDYLKNHLESTLDSSWDLIHIDHIIPCHLYDLTNEDEIKKCFNWRNLRYIPGKENLEKNGKLQLDLIELYDIKDLLPNDFTINLPINNCNSIS